MALISQQQLYGYVKNKTVDNDKAAIITVRATVACTAEITGR